MKLNLKWLFTAHYKDGTKFEQPADDHGSCPGLSSYHDVKQDQLIAFSLHNKDAFFLLDLRDGSYQCNAGRFELYTGALHNIKLAYCRRVTLTIASEGEECEIRYVLGFKALDYDNKPVERCLTIS